MRSKKLHKEEMPPLLDSKKYLIVDDIYDTGNTYSIISQEVEKINCDYAFLVRRFVDNAGDDDDDGAGIVGDILNHKKWIIFPWERKTKNNVPE